MKLTKLLTALVVISASAVASAATTTQNIANGNGQVALPAGVITLTVTTNCVINTGLAGVGTIAVAPFVGSGNFVSSPDTANFNCTSGTPYTVNVVKQANLTFGANNIPYTAVISGSTAVAPGVAVATGAQSGAGTGGGMSASRAQTVDYTYTILEANYLNAPPGNYSDLTIALTITY